MKDKGKNFYLDIMSDNDGVTGSCPLVSIHYPDGTEAKRILVDVGMTQGENRDFKKEFDKNTHFYFKPESINYTFITHPHADHIGKLPLLVKKGYSGKIFSTFNASKVMYASLCNNFQISKRKAKMLKEEIPFSIENVDKVIESLYIQPYQETLNLEDTIKVTYFENGHLSGAALILFQISCEGHDDINLLFTGDYKDKNEFFEVPELPDWVKKLPITVVTESTYGNENSYDPGNEPVFEKNLLEAINSGKEFIVPSCALERAQIILYKIKRLQDSGKLSENIPVLIDGGLAIQHTMTYQNQLTFSSEANHNILPKNVTLVPRKKRNEYLSSNEPKIVIASGGMGSFGAAKIWISSRLSKKNAVIHFTCYLAKDTLGRALFDAKDNEEVIFGGETLSKKADIFYTSEFSAHAKSDKLIGFLKQFIKLNFVVITHGEPEVKDFFLTKVRKEIPNASAEVLNSTVFHRINSNGFVKSMPTKF